MFAPSESAVGVDLYGVGVTFVVGEATHHAAVGSGGHRDAFRVGGKLQSSDMDAIVAPLRYAFKIESLQGG